MLNEVMEQLKQLGFCIRSNRSADGILRGKGKNSHLWAYPFKDGTGYITGSWKTGDKHVCRMDGSAEAQDQLTRRLVETADIWSSEESYWTAAQSAAARLAVTEMTTTHPYLLKKGIDSFDILTEDRCRFIIVPLQDIEGNIWSIQAIDRNGHKSFQFRGKKGGCFHVVGETSTTGVDVIKSFKDANTLLFCEGYATGITIKKAFPSAAVIACMSAGELMSCALALRKRFPKKCFVFCADNDDKGIRNIGLEKANAAAKSVKGKVVAPEFPDDVVKSDFNDLMVLYGLESVRKTIGSVL